MRSSIALDDLSPVFRAYLFPLVNKPPTGAAIQESNRRSYLFKNFETVYLGRSNTCLACHNSAWSMSGPQSYWNRDLRDLGIRKRHQVLVVAVKNKDRVDMVPGAEYVVREGDVLVVVGRDEGLAAITHEADRG